MEDTKIQNLEALATTEDVREVRIKNSLDKRTNRIAYKDENGKFVKTSEALARLTAKRAAALALAPSTEVPGLTAYEALLKNMMDVATKNTDPKNLIGVAKAVKTLEDATGITAQREAMLKKAEEPNKGITTIFIDNSIVNSPATLESELQKPKKTRPSWAEVTSIETNPAPNTVATKQPKHDRRQDVVPRRYCAGWGKRKEDSTKL